MCDLPHKRRLSCSRARRCDEFVPKFGIIVQKCPLLAYPIRRHLSKGRTTRQYLYYPSTTAIIRSHIRSCGLGEISVAEQGALSIGGR
jgi:hypothetical protein